MSDKASAPSLDVVSNNYVDGFITIPAEVPPASAVSGTTDPFTLPPSSTTITVTNEVPTDASTNVPAGTSASKQPSEQPCYMENVTMQ